MADAEKQNKLSIIAWSGDLDRIWPVLILSTTAVASGMQASVFFTFWGLFALVKPEAARKTGENWMQKMLAIYNPGSVKKAKLSKMNFAGAGPKMLSKLAKDYKTPLPDELLEMAIDMGVKIIPCQMTMDMLGLKREHLLDGLSEPVGAATALLEMKDAEIQLFV
ncbi:MAG TPA: DsrE/DsrF/DrsH-like family protein [Actinomycetota bacterium]|nr:DsrE/DsrF/DrsH-like family protein [Actinomycetota bacterium]